MNTVYRSMNLPLTMFGVEKRMFVVAFAASVLLFRATHSILAGLLSFGALYGFAMWATRKDPKYLEVVLDGCRLSDRYDSATRR